jgi:Xaa-Pro aminopeptidase
MNSTMKRLQKLRITLSDKNLEAILISQPENRHYLSNFTGSAGYLLITQTKHILATDFRYVEQAKRQAADYQLFQLSGDLSAWFPGMVEGLNLKEIGFEADSITCSLYQRLSVILTSLNVKMTPTSGLVENIRMFKEPAEITLINNAIDLSDAAVKYAEGILYKGMPETELAWEIERYMREHGSQSMPFEVIVAAGCNSALPHAQPCNRPIEEGEPIVIDIGARVEGYVSDLTRTLCLGKPDDHFNRIYNIVLNAQLAAENEIRSGINGSEADGVARRIIEEAGYGANFGHGLGHGLGLVAHESPRLGSNSKDILNNSMVFTIEPGIYLPDWGGVRIEDTVLLENDKIKVLSQAKK